MEILLVTQLMNTDEKRPRGRPRHSGTITLKLY